MTDDTIHHDQPAFDDFVERELEALGGRAQEKGICIDCFTDRLIVEMVASLTRAGIPASDILGMVADGMALAEELQSGEENERPRRVH